MARSERVFSSDSWHLGAACLDWPDADDFFPDRGDERPAVLGLCRRCPASRACAEQALRRRERYGIWGGLTERDRERIWQAQARHDREAATAPAGS